MCPANHRPDLGDGTPVFCYLAGLDDQRPSSRSVCDSFSAAISIQDVTAAQALSGISRYQEKTIEFDLA